MKVVDERFWLTRSTEIIADSAEEFDQGAQRVASTMAWFWTAYSGTTIAVLGLSTNTYRWEWALFIASPAVSIFMAYTLAVWASLPISIEFNAVDPYDIKEAHDIIIAKKRERLRASFGFAAVTAFLVSCIVIVLALSERRADNQISFMLSEGMTGVEMIIGGSLPHDATVLIRLTPIGKPIQSHLEVVKAHEPFTLALPVPRVSSYDVKVLWESNGRHTILQETIIRRPR